MSVAVSEPAIGERLPLRLLVVSRVVAARSENDLRFQALDGRYIDGIAARFRSTVVVAETVVEGEHEDYTRFACYAYHFTDPNLALAELRGPREAAPGILATALKQLRHGFRLARHVRRCDVAFLFLPSYPGALTALWCRLLRRPYAVYLGGDWEDYSPLAFRWDGPRTWLRRPYTWLNGLLERLAMGGARAGIVSGAELMARYRGARMPLVRTEPLAALTATDLFPREDTCLGEGCGLLFVGALLPGKGLQLLLRALTRLPDATLEVAGTGRPDLEQELRAVAAEAGIAERVRWHGYVADPAVLKELYRAADIFVLPTLSEGAPRVVWEAMSQGLPVVTSDIPAVRAVLAPDVDAVLVPPSDPEALATAIRRVRSDAGLRRSLIARGIGTARERLGRDPAAQAVSLLEERVVPHIGGHHAVPERQP